MVNLNMDFSERFADDDIPLDEVPLHRVEQAVRIQRAPSSLRLRHLFYSGIAGIAVVVSGVQAKLQGVFTHSGNFGASASMAPSLETRRFSYDPLPSKPLPYERIISPEKEKEILDGFHEHVFLQDAETMREGFFFELENYSPREQDQILRAMEALVANNVILFEKLVMQCPALLEDLKAIEQQRLLLEREKVEGEMTTVEIGSTVRSVLLAADDPVQENQSVPDMKRLIEQRSIDIKRQRARLKGSKTEEDMKKYKELAAEIVKIGAARMGLNDIGSRRLIRKGIQEQYLKDIEKAAAAMEHAYARTNPALITMALIIEGWRQEYDRNLQAKADAVPSSTGGQ